MWNLDIRGLMPSVFTDIRQFFAALRRRKVIQVAVVYALVAWVLIQIGEATFESLRLPDWSQTLLVVLALLGFPIALVLAWAFEITPDGVKRDPGDLATAENDDVSDGRPSVAVLPFFDISEEKDKAASPVRPASVEPDLPGGWPSSDLPLRRSPKGVPVM